MASCKMGGIDRQQHRDDLLRYSRPADPVKPHRRHADSGFAISDVVSRQLAQQRDSRVNEFRILGHVVCARQRIAVDAKGYHSSTLGLWVSTRHLPVRVTRQPVVKSVLEHPALVIGRARRNVFKRQQSATAANAAQAFGHFPSPTLRRQTPPSSLILRAPPIATPRLCEVRFLAPNQNPRAMALRPGSLSEPRALRIRSSRSSHQNPARVGMGAAGSAPGVTRPSGTPRLPE